MDESPDVLVEPSTSPFGDELISEATLFAPGIVSTEEHVEFSITFTPDAQTAYFTAQRNEGQPYTIYQTESLQGQWTDPVVAPFSGTYFDADAALSQDGSTLFFFSMRPLEGTDPVPIPDIWYTERIGNAWGTPENLGPPINQPSSGEGFMSITRDGTLYFSSVGRESGNHDVYRAVLDEGIYSSPTHLELAIESEFSNPYIYPDETFLIVDSRMEGGHGGGDLYVLYRQDEQWSAPVNLGPLVNTEADEGTPAFSPDGEYFFFSRLGEGVGDIYYISTVSIEALVNRN